jgi:hypothetical protein
LRDGISKKSQAFKAEFVRFCELKAKEFLGAEVERVRRNLQDDQYKSIDAVLEEVDKIKTHFNTQGPKFSTSATILADHCCLILQKAANHLTITSKHEMNISSRKL